MCVLFITMMRTMALKQLDHQADKKVDRQANGTKVTKKKTLES
jgi:hypothetical protein